MKRLTVTCLLLISILSLTGCYSMANAFSSSTGLKGQAAPELYQGRWLNSTPMALGDLKGKVVLLDFWRRSCPHCRKMAPVLTAWNKMYHKQGLQIIAIHSPFTKDDLSFMKLQDYARAEDVKYPIMTDGGGRNWDNYKMEYWPTLYLIDKKGTVRYVQVGAGSFEGTEAELKKLLAE